MSKQQTSVSKQETDERFRNGTLIAHSRRIHEQQDKTGYVVESQTTRGKFYHVKIDKEGNVTCNCKDFEHRQQPCKHIYAIINKGQSQKK